MARPVVKPIIGREVLPPRGVVTRAFTRTLEKIVADGQRYAATYPKSPPSSSYVRTRTLGRSWGRTVQGRTGSKLIGKVFSNANIAPYNVLVQGPSQTAFHAMTGWRDIDDIADYMQKLIRRELPRTNFAQFAGGRVRNAVR